MKISKIPLLLLLMTTFTYESAQADDLDELRLNDKSFSSCDIKSSPISVLPVSNDLPKLVDSTPPTCSNIRSAKELYELWIKNNPQLAVDNLDTTKLETSKLNPQLSDKEKEWFLKLATVVTLKNHVPKGLQKDLVWNCIHEMEKDPGKDFNTYPTCKGLEEKLAVEREGFKDGHQSMILKGIFEKGKNLSEKPHKKKDTSSGASGENFVVTPEVTNVVKPVETNVENPVVTNVENPSPSDVVKPKGLIPPNTMTKECKEKLSGEIAELLADKSKNIIGLQFELTVLKMASLSVSEGEKTFEGLIKKKSQELKAIDNGSIDKMNQLYKKHGLPEDASKITDVLKVKASDPNYYNKHKRFFNNDSSAFMMAYQQVHPTSPIKEADISVLWFMDQVSKKAKKEFKEYQSEHNRTNLSTRIAQYTGAIDPKKKLGQTELDAMVAKQKQKIDNEFLAFIDQFKKDNSQCFNGEGSGDSECNLIKVEEIFGNLLAINSKIASTDVFLDKKLSGKINQVSFSIGRYVDSPSPVVAKVETKVEVKVESHEETIDPVGLKPEME